MRFVIVNHGYEPFLDQLYGSRPGLADQPFTLQLSAYYSTLFGSADFYRGETARKFAEEMASHGGLITAEDLANYKVVERSPLAGQAHVPFCKGFEGHQGTLPTANLGYFLFCSASFSSASASLSPTKVSVFVSTVSRRPTR